MRLVRFISTSGLCSRRAAADLIKAGHVAVNSIECLNPAYLVQPTDAVTCHGKPILTAPDPLHLILNKPLGVICASSSPHGETTVIDLVAKAYPDTKLYPIGRLDKDTTGLIILTNDGDLAYQLAHPKFNINKRYIVTLNKKLVTADQKKLLAGIELEDGVCTFDSISAAPKENSTVQVELHSGKNRIIRRMFGALSYTVLKLHRIAIGTLDLGNLPLGEYRKLTKNELDSLRALSKLISPGA